MIYIRIAISGSSGLIGGEVFKQLAKTNEVISIGRRNDCNIKVDFSNPELVKNIDLHGLEAIVHCAGVVDNDFKINPSAAYIQNTLGISALARRAWECGVSYFIYFSTAHVYGPLAGFISEKTTPNPLSDYAIAHYSAEQILKRYSIGTGIKVLVLRPAAVFGVPVDINSFHHWSLIPYSFPLEAVYTQKIVLRSSGEQRRNFIGINDLAIYVEKFLDASDSFDPFTVINPIGSEILSVYEFAAKCAQIFMRLTDKKCDVIRADKSITASKPHFSYGSENRYYISIQDLDNYISDFTKIIIEAYKRDHIYGK